MVSFCVSVICDDGKTGVAATKPETISTGNTQPKDDASLQAPPACHQY